MSQIFPMPKRCLSIDGLSFRPCPIQLVPPVGTIGVTSQSLKEAIMKRRLVNYSYNTVNRYIASYFMSVYSYKCVQ